MEVRTAGEKDRHHTPGEQQSGSDTQALRGLASRLFFPTARIKLLTTHGKIARLQNNRFHTSAL